MADDTMPEDPHGIAAFCLTEALMGVLVEGGIIDQKRWLLIRERATTAIAALEADAELLLRPALSHASALVRAMPLPD